MFAWNIWKGSKYIQDGSVTCKPSKQPENLNLGKKSLLSNKRVRFGSLVKEASVRRWTKANKTSYTQVDQAEVSSSSVVLVLYLKIYKINLENIDEFHRIQDSKNKFTSFGEISTSL
jgi:hypothetical protein